MDKKPKYHLFDVTGVELEYMIVDRDSLQVKPVADQLLFKKTGTYSSDYLNGKIDWSNELVNHVIELKTHRPESSLKGIDIEFAAGIQEISSLLKDFNAMMMPTASHPLMDPLKETVLWPHEYSEIYSLYNKIFDCRHHGWANLQCVHLNLPFQGDKEFSELHSAIRVLLPLIPAIAASSPVREGRLTGWVDSRMESYMRNQKNMPSLMGSLIPEAISTEKEYDERIFAPIRKAMEPYDPGRIMDHHFLNSRGAIARFDRGAVEIRVTDIQECPAADIAISEAIIETLKQLIFGIFSLNRNLFNLDEKELLSVFNRVIRDGKKAKIDHRQYLQIFDLNEKHVEAGEVWRKIFSVIRQNMDEKNVGIIEFILNRGSLSERIIRKIQKNDSDASITEVYRKISECLIANSLFE